MIVFALSMFWGYVLIPSFIALCHALAPPSFPCPTNASTLTLHNLVCSTPLDATYFLIPRTTSACEESCSQALLELNEKGYSFVTISSEEFASLHLNNTPGYHGFACVSSTGIVNVYKAIKDTDPSSYTDSHCICVRREYIVWTRQYQSIFFQQLVQPLQTRLETLNIELEQMRTHLDELNVESKHYQTQFKLCKQQQDALVEKEKEVRREKEYWHRRAKHFEKALSQVRFNFEVQLNEERKAYKDAMLALAQCQETSTRENQEKQYELVRDEVCDPVDEMNDESSSTKVTLDSPTIEKVSSNLKPINKDATEQSVKSPSAIHSTKDPKKENLQMEQPFTMNMKKTPFIPNQAHPQTQMTSLPFNSALNEDLLIQKTLARPPLSSSHLTSERTSQSGNTNTLSSSKLESSLSSLGSDPTVHPLASNKNVTQTLTLMQEVQISKRSNQTALNVTSASLNASTSTQDGLRPFSQKQPNKDKLVTLVQPDLKPGIQFKTKQSMRSSVTVPLMDPSFIPTTTHSDCILDLLKHTCSCDVSLSCSLPLPIHVHCCSSETTTSDSVDDSTNSICHPNMLSPTLNPVPFPKDPFFSPTPSTSTSIDHPISPTEATSVSFSLSLHFSWFIFIFSFFSFF